MVVEDNDVDDTLRSRKHFECSLQLKMKKWLRASFWRCREELGGLENLKDVKHAIVFQLDVRPVCKPMRRRWPKKEQLEK